MSSRIGNASFLPLKDAKKEKISTQFAFETSNHETDKNKASNFSPKSVIGISKSSSFFSLDESDSDSLSLSNRFSSNLSLSRKSSPFSSFDGFEEILISPFDLDEEDSKLIDEKEQDFDFFDEKFPSPSFNAMSNFLNLNSNSSKDFEFDEPIFWPFDYDSYKSPDLEKFLSMSPRKDILDNLAPVKKGLDPIRVRLHNKNNPKKVVSNPKTNLNSTNGTQKAPNAPSRFGKSSESSNDLKNKRPVKGKGEVVKQKKACGKGNRKSGLNNLLEMEISIENSIGLHEFDGHEGIEEFGGENEISLCGSPWGITTMMQSVSVKCARNKSNMSVKKFSEAKFSRF